MVRVIPTLLLRQGGLVKTRKYRDPVYVGDPINAVKIFNDKQADELMFLDIDASRCGAGPNFELLSDIASEAFMPFVYGGGVTSLDQARRLFRLGVEKVVIGTAAAASQLVSQVAALAGSSSVVASVDVRRNWLGKYSVWVRGGGQNLRVDPLEYALRMETQGAGEILLNAIDREGMQVGYDLDLILSISHAVSIPVVASCGAGSLRDFRQAVDAGASAVAAGSLFVFHGKHRAVLITYPERRELEALFN